MPRDTTHFAEFRETNFPNMVLPLLVDLLVAHPNHLISLSEKKSKKDIINKVRIEQTIKSKRILADRY